MTILHCNTIRRGGGVAMAYKYNSLYCEMRGVCVVCYVLKKKSN